MELRAVVHEVEALRRAGLPAAALALRPTAWERCDDLEAVALMSLESGYCQFYLSHYGLAQKEFARAYELSRFVSAPTEACAVVIAWAWHKAEYQDWLASAALLRQALTEYQPEGAQLGLALWNLGWAEAHSGSFDEGLTHFEQAATVMHRLGSKDRYGVLLDLVELLLTHERIQHASEVLATVGDALGSLDSLWRSRWHRHSALLATLTGRYDTAAAEAELAESWATDSQDRREVAQALLMQARIAKTTGQAALVLTMRAIELGIAAPDGGLVAEAMSLLKEVVVS